MLRSQDVLYSVNRSKRKIQEVAEAAAAEAAAAADGQGKPEPGAKKAKREKPAYGQLPGGGARPVRLVREPTTWTVLQHEGPNHLGL